MTWAPEPPTSPGTLSALIRQRTRDLEIREERRRRLEEIRGTLAGRAERYLEGDS